MPRDPKYIDIQKRIARLQKEAQSLASRERREVIARIRAAVAQYGISAAELGFARAARGGVARGAKPGRAGVAKYSDGRGNVWGGRGPRPRWLRDALAAGRSLQDFAVAG